MSGLRFIGHEKHLTIIERRREKIVLKSTWSE